ncbi:MAG: antibiotic biosynthesis monooxygenase [Campylobacteraceae bacterium]|nr:antibiotic biosynthesis monooxygenase [Campylobacteraceae bacterium]
MNIIIQEIYKANKEKEKDLQILLTKLLFSSVQEEGCVCFEVYQSDEDTAEFLVYTEFKDKEALSAHEESFHINMFNTKSQELVAKKEVLPTL